VEYLVQGNLALQRGSLLRIEDGRDMLVYVWRGSIWVTQAGDGTDRYVSAGGWLRIGSGGLTLVSALGRAALSLTSPHQEEFAERIELVHARSGLVETLFEQPGPLARLRARLVKSWSGWFAPQARPTTAGL
jgi:hypothetical protein